MLAFTNILVPFDESDAARRAVDAAVGIAADGAVVTLLQAADKPLTVDPTVVAAERRAGVYSEDQMVKAAEEYGDSVRAKLEAVADEAVSGSGKNLQIHCEAIVGSPAATIIDYAKAHDVDIIVMGRRGLGSVRAMLGSVSQRVAHETDLPLLLVK
ncbi:MAG: universal stress protein [Coriobacteriales bacterium]|jgi:nucleotide-binding universal stress UspA family protein